MNDFSNSFLERVPALIASGMDMDEAMQVAFDEEQSLCANLIHAESENYLRSSERFSKVKTRIRHRIYAAFQIQAIKEKFEKDLNAEAA